MLINNIPLLYQLPKGIIFQIIFIKFRRQIRIKMIKNHTQYQSQAKIMANNINIKNPFMLFQQQQTTDLSTKNIININTNKVLNNRKNAPFKPYQLGKHDIKGNTIIIQQKDTQNSISYTQNIEQQMSIKDKTTQISHKGAQQHINEVMSPNETNTAILNSKHINNNNKRVNLQSMEQKYKNTKTKTYTPNEHDDIEFLIPRKTRSVINEYKYQLNSDGDPPLLYDIGLDPQMITDKIKLVLKLSQPDYDMIMNPDLSGPILIAFMFGFLLIFSGQLQFGDVYALFIFGNMLLYCLFNFMAKKGIISLYNIMSIIGYCLIPMIILAIVAVFMTLKTGIGMGISLGLTGWSAKAAGNFLAPLVKRSKDRLFLLTYPLFLFYLCFALIIIF